MTAFISPLAVSAIEEDQIIDPNGTIVEEPLAESNAMDSILANDSSSEGAIVTMFGLFLIVAGIAVAAWFLFKRGVLRKPFANTGGKLKVAETRMLGNRQFIMVVEYEEQKILLGVGPGKIDYLTNLSSFKSEFPTIEQSQSIGGNA